MVRMLQELRGSHVTLRHPLSSLPTLRRTLLGPSPPPLPICTARLNHAHYAFPTAYLFCRGISAARVKQQREAEKKPLNTTLHSSTSSQRASWFLAPGLLRAKLQEAAVGKSAWRGERHPWREQWCRRPRLLISTGAADLDRLWVRCDQAEAAHARLLG